MVTLYAGDSSEVFTVHKEFACHYSPVLKAAFSSNFVEGQTQTYTFQDTSNEAVRLLTHWFYTQTLDTQRFDTTDFEKATNNPDFRAGIDGMFRLWVLAEKLLIPSLQNLVVRELISHRAKTGVTPTLYFNYVYENTSAGSPLRRLILDTCAAFLVSSWYSEHSSQFPKEMLLDLVTMMTKSSSTAFKVEYDPSNRTSQYMVDEE
jgi:hypothetical protein